MQDDNRITTLEPRQEPDARQIIGELLESIIAASGMNVFARLDNCNATRRCMWSGKSGDGRLPAGTDDKNRLVFRWPGAPDVGVPVCDKIVRWLAMKRISVLNRGDLRIAPRRTPVRDDSGSQPQDLAGVWQQTMEYFTTVCDWNLSHGFELFSTCVEEFGYGILMADWVKQSRMEKCEISLQTITDALAAQERQRILTEAIAAAGGAEVDPAAVFTAEVQQQIVQQVSMQLEFMLALAGKAGEAEIEMLQTVDPRMSAAEARRVIGDLARAATSTHYFAPRDDGGVFEVEALVPWVNCLHPHDLGGDGRGDWFAVPRYWSEAKIRERAMAEGWDKAATLDLIETQRNKFFTELYGQAGVMGVPGWALNGSGIGLVPDMQAMEKMPRWLVVYVWRKITTKEGRPMVYKAVVNPHMPEKFLLWEPTDLEQLPFLVDTSEPVSFAMQAMGVSDVVRDKQNFIKDRMDEEGARGQLGSNPPLQRTQDQNMKIHPGFQFYTKRGSGGGLLGTEFMKVPPVDAGSIGLMEKAERIIEEYYFRGETTAEEDKRMYHEYVTFKSVRCLRELYRLLWRLVQENIEELQVSSINGRAVNLDAKRDQLQGEADITIGVHLDGYSEDAADKFIDVLGKMIQADRAGTIDWSEAMTIAAQLLSPTYARRLVLTKDVATGRTIDDQEMRIAKIMAGVPVQYEERVSNPQLRMEVLQKWSQLPGNIQRAGSDPTVMAMMQKEQEQLAFQNEQQSVNPTTGRTGVKPNTPENLAAGG